MRKVLFGMSIMVLLVGSMLGAAAQARPPGAAGGFLVPVSITEPRVEVVEPAPMLTVQPEAYLVFKHTSCAMMPLELNVVKAAQALNVTVAMPFDAIDCMALGTPKEYRLQITSDYRYEKIHVVNLLEPSNSRAGFSFGGPGLTLPTDVLADRYAMPVKSPRLAIWHGPAMADVQPSAFIELKSSSCMERDLQAEVIKNGSILDVIIIDQELQECRGPIVERDYSVQISSDFQPGSQVRVLNPIKGETK